MTQEASVAIVEVNTAAATIERQKNDDYEIRWRNSSTVSSIFHGDIRCIITNRYKRVHAVVIWFCYFGIALDDYIFGPTFSDLAIILDVNFASIAYFTIVRQIGYTFGGLSGVVFNYINRQLCLVILLVFSGVTLFLTPYSNSLAMFYVLGGFNGFASGASDCGFHVWLMEMFGVKAGPYVQGLHVFFGLGMTLAPFITSNWLSPEVECGGGKRNSESGFSQLNATTSVVIDIGHRRAELFIPYAIIGSIVAACGLALLVLFVYKRYHPPIVRKKSKLPSSSRNQATKMCKNLPNMHTAVTVLGGSVLLGSYFGIETTYYQYMSSMVIASPLPIHSSGSAILESASAAVYTVCGALAMLVSYYLQPQHVIYVNFGLINVANVLLVFWGMDSLKVLWIGNLVMGAGFSSTFSSAYMFLEQQVCINNVVGSLFLFSTGVGMSIYPMFLLDLCEKPLNLIYCCIGGTNLACVLFICLHIASRHSHKTVQVTTLAG